MQARLSCVQLRPTATFRVSCACDGAVSCARDGAVAGSHDMQYPAARHLPALPQGGGSELEGTAGLGAGVAPPLALVATAAAVAAPVVAADTWDDELAPLALALLAHRSPGLAVVMSTAGLAAAMDAQEGILVDGSDPDVWLDTSTLAHLHGASAGASGSDWQPEWRVLRRAALYRWTGDQLLRAYPDGSTRVCLSCAHGGAAIPGHHHPDSWWTPQKGDALHPDATCLVAATAFSQEISAGR